MREFLRLMGLSPEEVTKALKIFEETGIMAITLNNKDETFDIEPPQSSDKVAERMKEKQELHGLRYAMKGKIGDVEPEKGDA